MKYTVIFLFTLLSGSASAQIVSESTWSVEYAEARTTPYDCPEYSLTKHGFTDCGDGPFIWLRVSCGEYTQPIARWDGQRWVKDLPCCMKYGGRRFIVIDQVFTKPFHLALSAPRS